MEAPSHRVALCWCPQALLQALLVRCELLGDRELILQGQVGWLRLLLETTKQSLPALQEGM